MFWDGDVCLLIYGKTILIKKFFGTMLTVFFIEMFIQYVQETRCFITIRSFCHSCASLVANKLDKASSCLLSTTFFSNWLLDSYLTQKASVSQFTQGGNVSPADKGMSFSSCLRLHVLLSICPTKVYILVEGALSPV
jgi:hypothetical protein